ncbi:DUF883 family protein [Fimbriiglobus ruber]|uniref:DUF3618 domain-containing protein n=1 Tax=Fimbriiglobus ruber TaxID=1908690 RepID=A0A225DY17_9BACT|nr:DUF883 family protein [Fimbriiglobus ruber]OWK46430.1 hypothetical protein FRUB_00129 [Fimbriiglobus ruber]
MEEKTPEMIEQEMHETRSSLTEKVSALEQHVIGTIQDTTTAVQDTVQTLKSTVQGTAESVRDTVQESVDAVKDTVKQTFDMSGHVRERPWAMLGGAVATGFVAGWLISRLGARNTGSEKQAAKESVQPFVASQPPQSVRESEPRRPGLVDDLLSMAGGEIKKLGEEALATVAASLHECVRDELPKIVTSVMTRAGERAEQYASQAAASSPPSTDPSAHYEPTRRF